jgi:hypothetical protein
MQARNNKLRVNDGERDKRNRADAEKYVDDMMNKFFIIEPNRAAQGSSKP